MIGANVMALSEASDTAAFATCERSWRVHQYTMYLCHEIKSRMVLMLMLMLLTGNAQGPMANASSQVV